MIDDRDIERPSDLIQTPGRLDILLSWPRVQQVLSAIDAIEADGLDPCETAPDHWRHIGSHIVAGLPFRPYGPERHRAWLQRKAIAP